jgi:hypothetical protein
MGADYQFYVKTRHAQEFLTLDILAIGYGLHAQIKPKILN